MSTVQIYHNPRCSKSREALALLREHGIEPEVIDYLQRGLAAAEIEALLAKLGCGARALLRSGEPGYRERGLADAALPESALVAAMVADPKLLQRPLVVRGRRAVVARPAALALELIG